VARVRTPQAGDVVHARSQVIEAAWARRRGGGGCCVRRRRSRLPGSESRPQSAPPPMYDRRAVHDDSKHQSAPRPTYDRRAVQDDSKHT
jgi:hypothetical protein